MYLSASVSRISLRIITALLLLNALIFFYAATRSLFFLGDITVPEGAVIYSVKGLLTGSWPLYRDYTYPPYSTTPYTPLFYLGSALMAWGTTKSISSMYICSRLLTLLSTCGSAFFVRNILLLLKPDAFAFRYVTLLLPFTILTLFAWGFTARPDMLAIMLSLAGIYIFLSQPQSSQKLCYCAIILALSWWCKQSFIAAPIAVFLSLLMQSKGPKIVLFCLTYLVVVAILAGITQYLSHGLFYNNIVTANVTTLQISHLNWLPQAGFFYVAPFIAIAACIACCVYFKDILKQLNLRCIILYLLISFLLNAAASLKEGAYINYFLEPLFIASLLAILTLLWIFTRKYTAIAAAAPVIMMASLLYSYHFYWNFDGELESSTTTNISVENSHAQFLIDKVNAFKGDVLISDAGLAVRSQKTVLIADLFNAYYLEREGKLSTELLAERIKRQELAAIVTPEGCIPSAVMDSLCQSWPGNIQRAMAEKYEPRETLYKHEFWYPK